MVPARGRAVFEQQLQAGRVLRLGRVVDGLAVVWVGARLEQPRQLRIVQAAGRAVERAHSPLYSLTKNALGSAPRRSSSRARSGEAKHECVT